MTFPDATAMAEASTAVTTAYNALPFLATIFGTVVLFRLAPMGIRLFKRAFGGG